jgi:hypothetical protein
MGHPQAVRKWQLNNLAKGLCRFCKRERVNSQLCEYHREKRKQLRRKKNQADPIWLELGMTKAEYLRAENNCGRRAEI